MKNTLFRLLLLLLMAGTLMPVQSKSPRKRPGTTAGGGTVVEPDALVLRLREEKTVQPQGDVGNAAATRPPRGRINTTSTQGIDISHYQYTIDWDRLARTENISYVFIKATEGNSLYDNYYRQNLEGARRVGISAGSYHFYRPNVDWRSQFEFMKSVIKAEEQDLVPLIDIEKYSGPESTFISNLQAFVAAVEKHYGRRPLLYTYQNFYNKHFQGLFRGYHWMIACYSSNEPTLNDGRDYIMWQYSCSGRVAGIRGDVDRSCLMRGFELRELQM